MPHTIEPAASGRAKCRACGAAIAKGELRFGERLPNPFAEEGEMTLWFHLACGAFKRPGALLEALRAPDAAGQDIERREWLEHTAEQGVEHRRLPRANGAERASTARAACRSCRERIPKDSWRIRLEFFEDGRFNPSGFIHVACAEAYLGTTEILERLKHFSAELGAEDELSLERSLSKE
jgi:hypothetical protein